MTSPMIRRPLGDFQSLRRLNQVLDEAFNAPWPFGGDTNGTLTATWVPACDVFEDKDAVKIVAELPGVQPDHVKISLENNLLTVRGEKKQVAEEKTERVHRYERTYGIFERTFALPSTVDADRIQADFEAGLLTIELPKAEKARPRQIQINAK